MQSLRLTFVALAALTLGAAPVEAAGLPQSSFAPNEGGQISFTAPSDNIECIYTPKGGGGTYVPEDGGPELSCDRLAPVYLRFTLAATGKAELIKDVGDQGCCGDENPLAYGTEWRQAPYTCDSAATGLTCHRDDGHGFFISKAKTKVY
jgi:hypothetical protein